MPPILAFANFFLFEGLGANSHIARLLGWTCFQKGAKTDQMNHTAKACAKSHHLISGGYMSHEDLDGLSVSVAERIVSRAWSESLNPRHGC